MIAAERNSDLLCDTREMNTIETEMERNSTKGFLDHP